MEISKTSFFELLRDISETTRHREESEADYHHFLRNIFKEGGQHDTACAYPEVESHVPILIAEKVLGREQEVRQLLLRCCNTDEEGIHLSAIPIVGAAGMGKTTLARRIYKDELMVKHFEMRVWVKVDGVELTLHHAAQQILKCTTGMACSVGDQDELDEMVRDTLVGRRCLIVFDGVESMREELWLHMNNKLFDFVDVGSKALITTSSQGVAKLLTSKPFELKPLSQHDGWTLCQLLALVSSDFEDEMCVVENLETLCKCIPLLVKLVGSMMRYHDEIRNLLSTVRFSDAPFLSDFDASVAILLCVWVLPPRLRQCLALCSIFPKGYALDREKIINLWAAHGLVKPSPENNLRDIGDSYFHQLLCRSFFTDIATNKYGDITEFQMPGLIHTIMQDVAGVVWKSEVGVIGSISEDADRLSLHSEWPKDVTTLIFSSTLQSGASSLDYTFLDFHELKSLDLSCSGIRSLSDDICALRELKYINLSYTFIERLPDSFTELLRLQTLDVSWCYHFKFLPEELRDLRYMTHLDLSKCESLSYLPSGIGSLESLTSMPLFVLGKDRDSARLGELGMLNQLRGRLEITNLENVMEISEARDAKLNQKKLHYLGLCWSKNAGDCVEVLELLEPNQGLKILDITGYMGSNFPHWISSLSSLIKISITDCGCKELPSLGQLPLLKELHLKGMTNLQYIGPEFYGDGVSVGFPSLEQLGLYDMPNLLQLSRAWGFDDVCPSLKTLTIEGCPRLFDIPTFKNLLDLRVCNSSNVILSWSHTPSFLLIKNMELRSFLMYSITWRSLKKLILFNTTWDTDYAYLNMSELTELEHLGVAHCPQLRNIKLRSKNSLEKLHVVDCPNFESIYFHRKATNLTELVVDGCPELNCYFETPDLCWLTKLIIRGCNQFFTCARDFKELKKLQYLCISECPLLEKELEMDPSLISHIPRVLLGNHKVEHTDCNDSKEDTNSESKHGSQQESTFKGSSLPRKSFVRWASVRAFRRRKQPLSTRQLDSRRFHV